MVAVTFGTFFILKVVNNDNNRTTEQDKSLVKTAADNLQVSAIEAMKNNDNAKAKILLTEAQQKYESIGSTNKVIDIKSQLQLIEYQNKQK